jgi:peptidoglycan hydrolase CwlO-like protein
MLSVVLSCVILVLLYHLAETIKKSRLQSSRVVELEEENERLQEEIPKAYNKGQESRKASHAREIAFLERMLKEQKDTHASHLESLHAGHKHEVDALWKNIHQIQRALAEGQVEFDELLELWTQSEEVEKDSLRKQVGRLSRKIERLTRELAKSRENMRLLQVENDSLSREFAYET